MGSVRFVSRETACFCDFPGRRRLNGVQARPVLTPGVVKCDTSGWRSGTILGPFFRQAVPFRAHGRLTPANRPSPQVPCYKLVSCDNAVFSFVPVQTDGLTLDQV